MTALSLEQLWQRIAEDPDHVFLATPDHELSYGALGSRIRIELARFDAAGLELGQRLLIRTALPPLFFSWQACWTGWFQSC